MDEARIEELRRLARLREQQDEERMRKIAADRLQQERQAQDEARQAAMPSVEEQHYARLPGHSYTGIR
ncbi:hypothetical protein [Streptomyces cinereoruber]